MNLKEYRKINTREYVLLGKLHSDLNSDELVHKRANIERVKEFSRNLRFVNKEIISSCSPATPTSTTVNASVLYANDEPNIKTISSRERVRPLSNCSKI